MRSQLLFCMACAIQLIVAAIPSSAITTDRLGPPVELAEVRGGMLLYLDEEQCQLLPAPILETDVEIEITGIISRARVRQHFHNPTDEWLEGVYVFPLPTSAAIDGMRLLVGNRVIEGEIQERAEAKRTYEAAKQAGRKASLLEQERPNLFTISVANIGPGEQVVVEICYQEDLTYLDGSFSLRFPLVVLPRYIPGTTPIAGEAGTGWARNTPQVPDAARITPPVVHPSAGPINPLRLHVNLNAGFPLAEVLSPSHSIRAQKDTDGRYRVELQDGAVPADRDFVLNWRPAIGAAPTAALFTQQHQGEQYLLLMVMPPQVEEEGQTRPRIPRETVFVIDTSGSMSGISIMQARQALQLALRQLRPGDSFNVIQFNSTTSSLFPTSEDVTPATLRQAFAYVAGLRAQGGTEMLPALEAALDARRPSASRLRQVIFMTDGSVGNEPQLFGHIDRHLGSSRLFTVGIGSAPNSFFMRRAAQFGRGTFTHIGTVGEVEEKMGTVPRDLPFYPMAGRRCSIPVSPTHDS